MSTSSKKPIKIIEVTTSDIRNGVRRDPEKCPIALAASRKFGCPISVSLFKLHDLHKSGTSFYLSESGVNFRQDFDGRKPVKPCKFLIYEE